MTDNKNSTGPKRDTDNGLPENAPASDNGTFSGTPALYRKFAIFGSIGVHLYLFVGFYLVKNFLAGESWPTSAVPIVAGLVSALIFAFFAFRWMMRLDARYGRGSGWDLVPTTVKLPWQKPRD